MAYKTFQEKVNALIKRAGGKISVRFSNEDGKYFAHCSGGVTIISNSACPSVMVKWGSGHKAIATI